MSHVTALRMRQAMALLASKSYTVETVAQQVGYENPFAFSAAFKRHQGISPSEYRQKGAWAVRRAGKSAMPPGELRRHELSEAGSCLCLMLALPSSP